MTVWFFLKKSSEKPISTNVSKRFEFSEKPVSSRFAIGGHILIGPCSSWMALEGGDQPQAAALNISNQKNHSQSTYSD